jgi:hypothetical protein
VLGLLYASAVKFSVLYSAVGYCINSDFISALIISGLVNLLAAISVTEI